MLERLAKLREESKGGDSDEDEDEGEDEGKEGEGNHGREYSAGSTKQSGYGRNGDENEEEKGAEEDETGAKEKSLKLAMPRPDLAIAELESTLGYTPRSSAPDSPDGGEDYVVVEEEEDDDDDEED